MKIPEVLRSVPRMVGPLTFSLLASCATAPDPTIKPRMEPAVKPQPPAVKTLHGTQSPVHSSLVDATPEDWKSVPGARCVTHLYECRFDEQGEVKDIQGLDLSASAFQKFTEESLRAWRFPPGQAGSCFAQFVYERDHPTRVLIVPPDLATRMAQYLQKNRSAARTSESKPVPTLLRQAKPQASKELAARAQDAHIRVLVEIDEEGIPQRFRILEEEPKSVLKSSALDALKDWRYASLADEPDSRRDQIVTIMWNGAERDLRTTFCDPGLRPDLKTQE